MHSLAELRILSTAVNVPGPFAVAMLRDRGAAVIKIEPPAGDPLKRWAPDWYAELCAGIEVVRLDLKSPEGRERLHASLSSADLLVTSSRARTLARLGLGWTELRTKYLRLSHVAIVGYAAPHQDHAGHDLTYQARAGLLTPPGLPSTLIADLAGGQYAVIEALSLLLARERTGRGGYAEVALAEAAAHFSAPRRHGLTASNGLLGGGTAAYGVYRASDGWVAVAALEPHFRDALARELGVDAADAAAVARTLAQQTAVQWQAWAEARDLPMHAVSVLERHW